MSKKEGGIYYCNILLDNIKNQKKLKYIYFSVNEFNKPQYERKPMTRWINIENNIVNGVLMKHDGNFL